MPAFLAASAGGEDAVALELAASAVEARERYATSLGRARIIRRVLRPLVLPGVVARHGQSSQTPAGSWDCAGQSMGSIQDRAG